MRLFLFATMIILQKLLQKIIASQKKPTHRIELHATIFCNHLAKLLRKFIITGSIASHVATIFCNHLAKLLQKIIASKKPSTSHPDPEIPDLKMLTRARNDVWMSKWTSGNRGFRGLIASYVATIFCNQLANLLQKIASVGPTHYMA